MEIIVKNKDFSVEQQKQIELLNQYLLKSALNLSRNCSQKEKNEDTSAQGIKPFIKPIVKRQLQVFNGIVNQKKKGL